MIIRWLPIAIRERGHQIDWYGERNALAAIRMDREIEATVARLARFPSIGRVGRLKRTYEITVQRTRFVLIYHLADTEIVVLRLMHSSQRWPAAIDLDDD